MLDRQTTGFIGYFFRAYPRRSALMVVLLVFAGIAEGVGIVTLLPVLEVAMAGEGQEPSGVSLAITRALEIVGLSPTLGVLLLMIVGAMALKGTLRWLAMREVGYTVAQFATDLRLRLMRALMKARWSYFASQPAGYFANAISNEAHRASMAYRQACGSMAGVIELFVYLAVVALVSWQVGLAAIVVGLGVMYLLRTFVGMARKAAQRQKDLMRSLVRRLTEALPGIKPVKAMGREDQLLPLLEGEARGFNDAQRRTVLASESMRSLQEPLLAVFLAAGLFAVLTWGNEPFSAVLVLAFLFYRTLSRVNQLQAQYQDITQGESHFWSMISLVEETEAEEEESRGKQRPPTLESEVRLQGVSFAYGAEPVLRNVDLVIPAGSFVGLVGPSGAGKTTLADLVVGLHRPEGGQILVDDVPLSEVEMAAWRAQVGYVPQEMLLFNGSIFRNVTLGNEEIGREEARRALEDAGAWDFVERLPEGLDQEIGEMGTKLSGGQRQRIAIARALVGGPRLLILDEATTALDPETEAAICDTLRSLRGQVTILAISHQAAIREAADIVYEVASGRVREASTSGAVVPGARVE